MDDRWLSVDDICTHLGISRDTIYKWIDRKGMPAHRVGRLRKCNKAEIDDWVRAGGGPDRNPAGADVQMVVLASNSVGTRTCLPFT